MITIFKKQWQRILSVVLAVAMVVNVTPFGALNVSALTDQILTIEVKYDDGTPFVFGEKVSLHDGIDEPEYISTELGTGIATYQFISASFNKIVVEANNKTHTGGFVEGTFDKTETVKITVPRTHYMLYFHNNGYGSFSKMDGTAFESGYHYISKDEAAVNNEYQFKFKPEDQYKNYEFEFDQQGVLGYCELVGKDGEGVHTYKLTLNRDHAFYPEATVEIVPPDTTPPTLNIVDVNNTAPVQSREITFSATDDTSTTVKTYVEFSAAQKSALASVAEIVALGEAASYTANENGYCYVYAIDEAGNIASTEIAITNIDKTAPAFTTQPTADNTSYAQSRDISFATDDGSAAYYVSTADNLADFTGLTPVTSPCTVTANGTYYIYAVDAAGNITKSYAVTVENIDTTAPQFDNVSGGNADPAQSKDITFVVSDTEAGVSKVVVSQTSYDVAANAADINALAAITSPYNVTANGTYYLYAVDGAGNIAKADVVVQGIDTIKPGITGISSDPDTWTNDKVAITVEASDDVAVDRVVYSSTDITDVATITGLATTANLVTAGKYTFEVSAEHDGNYYVWVIDTAGNVSAASTAVVYIDKTNPVVASVNIDPATWTNGTVTVSGTTTETNISKVVYSTTSYDAATEGTTIKGLATVATLNGNDYSFTVSDEYCGKYYVWAIDAAGNISAAIETPTIYIDKTAAEVDTPSVAVAGHKFNRKATVTVTVTNTDCVNGMAEKSDIAKVVYSDNSSLTGPQIADLTAVDFADGKYTFVIDREFNEKPYYIWAIDTAGNISAAKEVKITIDQTVPVVGTITASPAAWTNSDVLVEMSVTDGGPASIKGVAKVVYSTNPDLTDDQVLAEATTLAQQPANATADVYTFTVSSDFNGKYYVWAVDESDNVSDRSEVTVQRDTVVPTISGVTTSADSDVDGWVNTAVTVTVTTTDGEVSAATTNSGVEKVVYSEDNTLSAEEIKALSTTATISGDKYEFTIDTPDDTILEKTYYVWTIDVAGNISAVNSATVKIDKVDPEVTDITAEGTTSAFASESVVYDANDSWYFSRETTTVTIVSADQAEGSGVEKVEYNYDNGTWDTYTAALTDAPNKQYVVYAKVTDKAGNVSEIVKTKTIVLDDKVPVDGTTTDGIAPKINITLPQADMDTTDTDEVTIYSSAFAAANSNKVVAEISVIDPKFNDANYDTADGIFSGIKEIAYTIKATDTNEEEIGTIGLSGATAEPNGLIHTFSSTLPIDMTKFNSNNVTVELTAVDNAGNISELAQAELAIDITAPEVKVTYDNNSADSGTFFKNDRVATIVVTERNFAASDVVIKATKNGTTYTPAVTWTAGGDATGNGDKKTNTATIAYNSDGDYTFEIAFQDLANNAADTTNTYAGQTAPQSFTIDKTDPTVSVGYSNNAVTNGKYFNASRTATITVTEHNFDLGRVTIKQTASINGAAMAAPAVSWSHSGDIHTATINYSADGDYTFDISVTDKAGRMNTGVEYGSSAAPKDFTVDTTIEKPLITGVANGVAYKGTVAPAITFNDINYESHTISLLRTRLGARNVDVTAELLGAAAVSAQGFTLTAANFEEIRENDGIYTLTVTATDRAGNEEMETVTFTVNRFGSVYVYDDYLADLIVDGGKYVKSVEGNLIITEYNPDRLVEGSLIIEVTRDGKPVDAEFTVSPEINEYVSVGESGWFQYRYVIDKANFTSDGIYKISVSSQDATGNYPELANFEDMEILFRVDSTVPEITSVVGLEEDIVNAQELEIKYTLFDAIALKSVKIFVDGNLAEEITTFDDLNNYEGKFVLAESSNKQSVRIVVEDMAGNIIDTGAEDFVSAYVFNSEVTVSTNIFVRWFANKPLFFGSIGGAAAVVAAAWYFLIFKRRKEE